MRIKKTISINLKDSNLNIYKLDNRLIPKKICYKKEGNYVEVECEMPKNNVSLIRNKRETMNYYSYGYKPNTNYYLILGDRNNKGGEDISNTELMNDNDVQDNNDINNNEMSEKNAYKIQNIYKFNTIFPEKEEVKSTIQFRKVETREDIEHRKKNINYKIKNIENEEFVNMDYKKNTSEIKDKDIAFCISSMSINNEDVVEKAIYKRVVVNYKDLVVLYGDNNKRESYEAFTVNNKFKEEELKTILQRNTFYLHGRYILKNKFYDKILQEKRNNIINMLKESEGIIIGSDGSNKYLEDDSDYKRLLEELCIKERNKYKLKGYYESMVLDNSHYGLLSKLREINIFNMQDIKEISKLDVEDIYKFINTSEFMEVGDNYYVIEKTKEVEEVMGLLNIKTLKKSDVNKIVLEKNLNMEEFFKIFEKFYTLKRGSWVRNN